MILDYFGVSIRAILAAKAPYYNCQVCNDSSNCLWCNSLSVGQVISCFSVEWVGKLVVNVLKTMCGCDIVFWADQNVAVCICHQIVSIKCKAFSEVFGCDEVFQFKADIAVLGVQLSDASSVPSKVGETLSLPQANLIELADQLFSIGPFAIVFAFINTVNGNPPTSESNPFWTSSPRVRRHSCLV